MFIQKIVNEVWWEFGQFEVIACKIGVLCAAGMKALPRLSFSNRKDSAGVFDI